MKSCIITQDKFMLLETKGLPIMNESKILKQYEFSYKKSLLSKKYNLMLIIYDEFLYVECFGYNRGLLSTDQIFDRVDYDSIKRIYQEDNSLYIQTNKKYETAESGLYTDLCFPDIANISMIIKEIEDASVKHVAALERQIRVKKLELELHEEKEKEQIDFFNKCMEFHIKNDSTPYYEYYKTDRTFSGIYVDNQKGLNFLNIDGSTQSECCAVISYDNIHYYEKAGNIHYVTETTAHQKTFGGYYKGASFSKAGAVVGGLLFGPMGMAAGVLLSAHSSEYVPPKNDLDFSSQTKEIDDRTVILNYYSDKKKQYMDMALQPELYNFLQTSLPEKKYEIVTSLEKEREVQKLYSNNMIEMKDENSSIDSFKVKVEKLKILHDSGMLSEEEFNKERLKLMDNL